MVALLVTSGPLSGQRIDTDRELILGRQGADFIIDDPEVSRRHARVRPAGAGLEIQDLGSLNGTLVNGVLITQPTLLLAGDIVEIAGTRLEVEDDVSDQTVIRQIDRMQPPERPAQPLPDVTIAVHPDVLAPIVSPESEPEAPAVEIPAPALAYTHAGDRFLLGFGSDFCAVWDRRSPSGPVRRFPRTEEGWADAWRLFSDWEPSGQPVVSPAAGPAQRFAPSGEAAQSGTALAAGVEYAGFWRRAAAVIGDGLILSGVLSPLFVSLRDSTEGRMAYVAIELVVSWLYEALQVASARQATIGKHVMGIKVTDLSGRRLSFAHASARYFAKILSAITLGIGYLMAAFTPRKQALHDIVAGTLVLRAN